VKANRPVLGALHSWLDSRRGIGAVGMGVLRTSSDEPTVMPSRGGMTSNLVTNHKALNPTRRARNNINATLVSTAFNKISISTIFIGTPVSSVLYLRRSVLAIGALPSAPAPGLCFLPGFADGEVERRDPEGGEKLFHRILVHTCPCLRPSGHEEGCVCEHAIERRVYRVDDDGREHYATRPHGGRR
jgi:hypothetical protein